MLFIESEINHNTVISGAVAYDTWTSASESAFDTATGASGQAVSADGSYENNGDSGKEQRVGANGSLSRKQGSWVFVPGAGFSSELDYRSINGGLTIQKLFAEDNTTLAVGFRHFNDSAHVYDIINRAWTGWKPRTTQSMDASVSQILSPRDIILLGCGIARQSGFLEGNRNTVSIAGTRVVEVLPDRRNKFFSTLRYVHGITPAVALHADYRYYQDDWRIRAHTFEPSFAFALQDEQAILQLLTRYYRQQETKYYGDAFNAAKEFITSDSDLSRFIAREIGARYVYGWDTDGFFDRIEAGVSLIYYKRSNDLRAVIGQLSINGRF
jgi:hypothetical protein